MTDILEETEKSDNFDSAKQRRTLFSVEEKTIEEAEGIIADEKNRDNPESLPAQDGPAKETAVLDVDGALKRLAGQRRIYLNALQKSMPEFGQTHELMIRQLASGDTVAAEITAHNVKGTAATIGAVGLNQVAAKLEKAIKDGGPDLEGLLNGFKRELEATLEAVKGLLEAQNQ